MDPSILSEGPTATDAYINARFIPEGSPVTVPFEASDAKKVAAEHQPRPRRFTIRRWDSAAQLLSIDFVAHGDSGYAGSWAQRAKPGDRLQFEGPGGSYRPSPDVDWHLFVGDESALGAIGASLESLDADARALVFAIVERPGYEIDLPSKADVEINWLYREDAAVADTWVADALASSNWVADALVSSNWVADALVSSEFPAGTFDVFVHGEAAEVRAVRLHLAADRGVDIDDASISPYWRRRHTDEDWRKVKRKWMADQSKDVLSNRPPSTRAGNPQG